MTSPTTPPSYTAPPTDKPIRGDRATFSPRLDAFVSWLGTGMTDMGLMIANAYTNAVAAFEAATAASGFASDADGSAGGAEMHKLAAQSSANAAAASAATAISSPGTSATSTTSLAIGSGSKTLTIQTGKSLPVGQWLNYADAANPTSNYMNGQCSAHNTSTGLITILVPESGVKGSGTISNWVVSQSGVPGPAGVASPAMNIFIYNNF